MNAPANGIDFSKLLDRNAAFLSRISIGHPIKAGMERSVMMVSGTIRLANIIWATGAADRFGENEVVCRMKPLTVSALRSIPAFILVPGKFARNVYRKFAILRYSWFL